MHPLQHTLEEIGLPDKEATVYLTLLSVGPLSVSTLAQRTRLPRSTVQFTCQQLAKRGVVRVSVKNRTNYYSPEPPEKLVDVLRRQHEEIQARENALQRAMGALKEAMNPHVPLPKVEYYEGQDGMIELYEKILGLGERIDSFEDKGEMVEAIPAYVESFIAKRVKRGIFNRVICPAENSINVSTPKELRETRTIPTEEFPFTCDIKICGDLVSIFSFEERSPVGIAIRHAEIAENFRLLHKLMWGLLAQDRTIARKR